MVDVKDREEFFKEVGGRLAKLKGDHDFLSSEVAGKLNIHRDTYSRMERGGGDWNIYSLYKLCELYGVTADSILFGECPTSEAAEVIRLFEGQGLDKRRKALKILKAYFED